LWPSHNTSDAGSFHKNKNVQLQHDVLQTLPSITRDRHTAHGQRPLQPPQMNKSSASRHSAPVQPSGRKHQAQFPRPRIGNQLSPAGSHRSTSLHSIGPSPEAVTPASEQRQQVQCNNINCTRHTTITCSSNSTFQRNTLQHRFYKSTRPPLLHPATHGVRAGFKIRDFHPNGEDTLGCFSCTVPPQWFSNPPSHPHSTLYTTTFEGYNKHRHLTTSNT
jgi:hypothetical protein